MVPANLILSNHVCAYWFTYFVKIFQYFGYTFQEPSTYYYLDDG